MFASLLHQNVTTIKPDYYDTNYYSIVSFYLWYG